MLAKRFRLNSINLLNALTDRFRYCVMSKVEWILQKDKEFGMNKRELSKAYKLLHRCYSTHEVFGDGNGGLILSITYLDRSSKERSTQFNSIREVRDFVNSRIVRNVRDQIYATLFELNDAQRQAGTAVKMMESAKSDLSVESHLDHLKRIKRELREAIAKIQEAEKEFVESL